MAAQWVRAIDDIEATPLMRSQWLHGVQMYYWDPPFCWGVSPMGFGQFVQPPTSWTVNPPPRVGKKR
jgi:hypothetical protein